MTHALVLVLALGLAGLRVESQEKPRIPDDSVELTVIGCLKGRALTTVDRRDVDVERGPYVGERTFRLNGKRDVMDEVKRRNRQLVEVIGVVKRSALDDKGVKSGRISISGGSPVAGGGRIPTGVDDVPVMDVTSVRMRATACGPQ
jgi:hypothetical protein